ncbi:MAG: zinc ribbon domain-containing protein [Chloroflexi bacterium]|nr:zinc ribbon domain-containing protein [Chloroflexota bacterium]
MPIYEYECDGCGKRFEVRQAVGQGGSDLKCPDCGAIGPRRLFSSFFCPGSGDLSFSSAGSSCSTCSSGNCTSCGI